MRTLAEIDAEIAKVKGEMADVRGDECEVYSRITGYYRATHNWNLGKKEEFKHRKMYDVPPECCHSVEIESVNGQCESCKIDYTDKIKSLAMDIIENAKTDKNLLSKMLEASEGDSEVLRLLSA